MRVRPLARWMAAAAGAAWLHGGPAAPAAETEAISESTPWRVFLVCRQEDRNRKGPVTHTARPPAEWTQADFDDSGWGRYAGDKDAAIGGYGYEQSPATALLCVRTRFGIGDPTRAADLRLDIEYRGGAVVYVNGREIARQHVPGDGLDPLAAAEAYPAEAFTDAAGAPLPAAARPAEENRERYELRIRRLSVAVPADALRGGANALAIELHPAPTAGMRVGGRGEWSTAGLCGARLASASGAGVLPYADAARKGVVWNASPLETVAVTPGKRQSGFLWAGITVTPSGLACGNPFDPLRPIRAVAPRGGTCSGQVVVTRDEPFGGLKATVSALRREGGTGVLPPEAVRVCYAAQAGDEMFCNALLPRPVEGAAVQPVWVVVDVPREQAAGWYTGEMAISAGPAMARVPVQILVADWTAPDPRDNATFVSLYQSPDTLAEHYKVDPWSDAHFALIEKSLRLMDRMGADVLLVPVILDNYLHHRHGLVRWVRKGAGHEPEFSAFERYLDLHAKIMGKPKVVTLSVWKNDFGARTWFRGMRSDTVGPCMVTELDPATGKMAPMRAPDFGQPGSEEFWQPMIEGVRKIVKARGCDDRYLLLGEAFDSRPLQPVVDFFQKIEPGMRWQIYSHWVGDPPPVNGKLTAQGGFETGLRINPNNGGLPEFGRENSKAPPATNEFYTAQAHRTEIHLTSSPLSYRNVMRGSGTLARIGLDFWPMFEDRGRLRSYYGCPPNEGWLWRGHCPYIAMAGPDGAVRTTRGQMLLEGVQETECHIAFVRARQSAKPELAARIGACAAARGQAALVGTCLSQATIGLDWSGMAAREYALAAELAGGTSTVDWQRPPATSAPEGGAK